jgi:protein involved in polysaccharide export with SLBB domain
MEPARAGRGRSSLGWSAALGSILSLVAGCAAGAKIDQALLADHNPAAHTESIHTHYLVHCPDTLKVHLLAPAPWDGQLTVGTDGRVRLGQEVPLRVEAQTTEEIARHLADQLHVKPDQVQVKVAGFNSQQLYVFGEVAGLQRAVAYQGPETVIDLLQRVGGLTEGSAPGEVQVVRSHVADGKAPEVFTIDLAAILLHKDQHSNIQLQPFDQIYIGQNKKSCIARCFPPWLRPTFETVWGMKLPAKQIPPDLTGPARSSQGS